MRNCTPDHCKDTGPYGFGQIRPSVDDQGKVGGKLRRIMRPVVSILAVFSAFLAIVRLLSGILI
jgi:hypothetical protein